MHFGEAQARAYEIIVTDALVCLTAGPNARGVRSRDDLTRGLPSLHVARKKRNGRHVILFRVDNSEMRTLVVLRVLHDSMDFARHLPTAQTEN